MSFVNVAFREDFPNSPTNTWPNGYKSYIGAFTFGFGAGGECGFANSDTIGDGQTGPRPIGRLFNGTNYADFSYSASWTDEYLNASSNWISFAPMQTTTEFRGSDQKCRETYQGVSGDWQGPWNWAVGTQ